jgi:hypothetical protein
LANSRDEILSRGRLLIELAVVATALRRCIDSDPLRLPRRLKGKESHARIQSTFSAQNLAFSLCLIEGVFFFVGSF